MAAPGTRCLRRSLVSPDEPRTWGFWTEAKLSILRDYLDSFLLASSGQRERVYLDAFAGEGRGISRLTGEKFDGSARLALEAKAGGGFTRLYFFEMEDKAAELEQRLKAEFPDRNIRVIAGDCNDTIPTALAELKQLNWAPTFAFIDPDGMEVSWETLRQLAEHKRGYRPAGSPKREYKIELWILFTAPGLMRTLAYDESKVRPEDYERVTRLFGTDAWRAIHQLKLRGEITPSQAREEYLNLLRWRLEHDLDYDSTHPIELVNTRGNPLYHMVFATDNEAGKKIMSSLYTKAAKDIPAMQREAQKQRRRQMTLDIDEPEPEVAVYEYAPPWEPPTAWDADANE